MNPIFAKWNSTLLMSHMLHFPLPAYIERKTLQWTAFPFSSMDRKGHPTLLLWLRQVCYEWAKTDSVGWLPESACACNWCKCISNGWNKFVAFPPFAFFLIWIDSIPALNMELTYISWQWLVKSHQFPTDHPVKQSINHESKWGVNIIKVE